MGKTYWMLVTNQRNFEITRSRGFTLEGVDSRNRRKAVRMAADDRIVYYLSDRKVFTAAATLASGHFEAHERIWQHYREREDFPHRVKVRPDIVLDKDLWLDALQIGPSLEYVKKWAPEDWPLAFAGMLHIIPQRDFSYLEEEMRRVLRKAGRPDLPTDLRVQTPAAPPPAPIEAPASGAEGQAAAATAIGPEQTPAPSAPAQP